MTSCCQIKSKYNANYLKLLNNTHKPLFQPLPQPNHIQSLIKQTQKLSKNLNDWENKCFHCSSYFNNLYQDGELRSLEKYYNTPLCQNK